MSGSLDQTDLPTDFTPVRPVAVIRSDDDLPLDTLPPLLIPGDDLAASPTARLLVPTGFTAAPPVVTVAPPAAQQATAAAAAAAAAAEAAAASAAVKAIPPGSADRLGVSPHDWRDAAQPRQPFVSAAPLQSPLAVIIVLVLMSLAISVLGWTRRSQRVRAHRTRRRARLTDSGSGDSVADSVCVLRL